jgi:CubicO group peptidase (beta-lactamase class C family)
MKQINFKIATLAIGIFLFTNAIAQKNYAPLFNAYMQKQVAENNFNGNVLVSKNGKIIYQKSFGYADFNTKRLLNDSSVFELASVSKQFTAMGILLLVEKGKIKLSDTLRKFFPQLPYSNITIKNMLAHTSGLPDYRHEMAIKWDHKKIAFNKDVINFLSTRKPSIHFTPGKKWEYSNTAYILLASIIEKVSGQTFKDYMAESIFKPLGMTHSRVYNTRRSLKEIIPNYAYGFVYSDSSKKYVLPDSLPEFDGVYYLAGVQGAVTINSTTGDLLKWEKALDDHTLLSKALQTEMLSPQSLCDTILKNYYGYGVFIGTNAHGKIISHRGGWPGYQTNLIHYPAYHVTIIALCNYDSNKPGPDDIFSNGLTDILFDKPGTPSGIHKEININPLLLNRYTGKYEAAYPFELIKKNGKVYQHINGEPDIELKPESNTTFFYPDNKRQIEFTLTPWGEVDRVFLIANDKRMEIKRTKDPL